MDWLAEQIKGGIIDVLKWIGNGLLNGIIYNSHWICLSICMIALLLYISGMKKAGKYVPVSFILYFILQSLKLVINE